jgi:RNA polymerase-binding transcription factor
VAKKTTKAKAAKTGARKKAPPAKTRKVVKKTAKKEPAAKKPVKKAAAKKPAGKKTVTKKPSARKTNSAKGDKSRKKPTRQTTKAQAAPDTVNPANPGDNGKSAAAPAKPIPPRTPRVVRPTPPPPAEPVIDDWTPLSDAKLRKVKTDLTRKDLNGFKRLLMEKRAQIVGDVLNMEESRAAGNGGDLSNMPLHMADIGSDNYEQEFTLGLVESERKLLMEIDAALMRIKNKTYGVCIVTGTPIPTARLEIKPWAKYSIEVVREREKRGLHSF